MEVHIKKTIKAGNSSAVLLPRAWLNQEVRVELVKKNPKIILSEVISILENYIEIEDIIGIYLTGSYARQEQDGESDIDILVITNKIDRKIINEGIYSILIISSELLNQKLKSNLFPIGQMLKEAKPLLNSEYLNSIKIKVTKENIKWYLNTTEDKLRIIEKIISISHKRNKKFINDKIGYTLILRIRTLYIIDKLIKNENYSKNDFIKLIKNISNGTNAYERYMAIKNNQKEQDGIRIEEAEMLYNYLDNQLTRIKKLIK